MRFCSAWKPAALALCALLAVGCETVSAPDQPKFYPKPTFDQSHAILIDKTVGGLPLISSIKDYVKKTEKIIVVSIERNESGDAAVNYLIDDNFIRNLITSGYRVLERDQTMLSRLIPEQGGTYKRSLLGETAEPPSVAVLDALEQYGVASMDDLSSTDLSALYKQLKEDYTAYESQQRHMESADVILSYRLLECGIIFDVEKKKVGTSPTLWNYDIKRDALARLFIRVMDAKTGEVRVAKVLQNEQADTVTFTQDREEGESDFFTRIDNYTGLLSKYHYAYYDQQLPNQRGTADQLTKTTDTTKKEAPASTQPPAPAPASASAAQTVKQ